MKKFRDISEAAGERRAVMVFGRMNPPTIGHAKLIDHALQQPGDKHIITSHSVDKKNPLQPQDKIDILHKMYPKHANRFKVSSPDKPSVFHHAAELHRQGYTHLTFVAGADRAKEFHDKLHQYNGKFNDKGHGYHFKHINVISAGERDPDAEGVEGISASKMRDAAAKGDHATLRKGLHHGLSGLEVHNVMKKIRKGMGLKEEVENIREDYMNGKVFKIGDMVEIVADGRIAEIIDRGTNYLTLVNEGKVFKKWLHEVAISDAAPGKVHLTRESFNIKGYKTKNFTKDLAEQFNAKTAEGDDVYAMLNCVQCVDDLLGCNKKKIQEDISKYKVTFERAHKYLNKFGISIDEMELIEDWILEKTLEEGIKFSVSDQNKIAAIIVGSAGIDPMGQASATALVNAAAKKFKGGKHTPEGWKIIGKMLNKASEAGIKWDKDIFAKPVQKYMELS